ncbi:MAG: hypothetical protein NDF55_04620 [archaeon GB-1867-005]|nr:hypothetical protein [Candidatus Culexmicrobium cathedralense]
MSVISPEALISEVKPWEKDSWRKFVEAHVVPVKALADSVAKQFVGDLAAEVAKHLSESASQIINVVKNVIGEVKVEFEVPSDPIECLRQLVEKCGNTFLGVGEAGKYTLFAWTLRKVTREYLLEALYSTLMDEEKRKKTFELLGIKEDMPLFKPAVESPLTDKLTILGYPDYPTICRVEEWGSYVTLSILPAREPTLGGSICKFVDGLVATLSRPGILSGVEPSADVVKLYLDRCPARPTEVYEYSWVELSWRRSYREFGELCRFRHDYAWSIQGFAIRCVDTLRSPEEWDVVRQETNLLSFLRWLMPSLVTGRTELLLSADGRVALTLERKY